MEVEWAADFRNCSSGGANPRLIGVVTVPIKVRTLPKILGGQPALGSAGVWIPSGTVQFCNFLYDIFTHIFWPNVIFGLDWSELEFPLTRCCEKGFALIGHQQFSNNFSWGPEIPNPQGRILTQKHPTNLVCFSCVTGVAITAHLTFSKHPYFITEFLSAEDFRLNANYQESSPSAEVRSPPKNSRWVPPINLFRCANQF